MLPNDFRLKSQYGQGVDWPITYEQLRPYYEEAEWGIGVSGDVDRQKIPGAGPDFYRPKYTYPMRGLPQSYLDQHIAAALRGASVTMSGETIPLDVIPTPQGRNSTPNGDYRPEGSVGDAHLGERCEGNASCVPICPVQAKYNALKTLSAARREHPGLIELQTQSVVSRLDLDPVSGLITGVRYRQYQDESGPPDPTESVARGRLYVVAANSIEAARLLLASGAANSSDQVGRNLMDHPVLLAWALAKEAVGGFRGPGSTSNVPSFRDGPFRRQHSAFISPIDNWGWSWPAFAPSSTLSQLMNPRDQGGEGLFGAALRRRLSHLVSRQVTFHYEFEQPPDPENRVTLDPVLKDPLGNARPRIRYSLPDYTLAAMAAARSVSVQVFQRLGAEDHTDYQPGAPGYVTYQGKGYVFNGAGHLVGTHRMGSSRSNSVVSPQQRTWDHPNLFLVGCGNMPTLGTSNPTLTMAALADWAGDHIVRDLTP
jgi:choline dehydrogenase-like flavoprotein